MVQAILYTVGIGSCLLWALLAESAEGHRLELLALVLVAVPLPAVLLIGFRDLPRWVFEVVMALANALIATAIWVSHDLNTPFALLFLWATPYAFAFYTRRQAMRQLAFVALGYALALALLRGSLDGSTIALAGEDLVRVLIVTGTLGSVSLVIWRLRQALTASSQRFKYGFDNAVLGMALVAPDGRFLRANHALAEMFNLPRDEIPGMHVRQTAFEEDFIRLIQPLEEALAGGRDAFSYEARYFRRGGGYRWALFSTSLVRDGEGAPLHFYSQLQDIHERKLADAQLRQRAAQQAAVAKLGQHALGGADLSALMKEVVEEVVGKLGVDQAGVLELAGDGESVVALAGQGWPQKLIGVARFSAAPGTLAGSTLAAAAPLIVEDFREEQRFSDAPDYAERDIISGMTVAIAAAGERFGILTAHCERSVAFNADDAHFLQSAANVLATAIQRRRSEEAVRYQALHDAVTGLPNRSLFMDRLAHALKRAERRITSVGVLFLDLDNFKVVNDSLGHEIGDELLRAVAPRLEDTVRAGDTVARFGGDEFVVLCEDVESERELVEIADRLVAAIARPFELSAGEHVVTASIGVAVADAGHVTPDALVRDADAAMYRAKERGRHRHELFDAEMRRDALERLRIEADLRRAIEHGELVLRYQPVVGLADGKPVGVEALVRWQHPTRGMISPGDFIPVAEESGLIVPLGKWVLEEACRQAAAWQGLREGPGLAISVNLSARQLADPSLPDVVRNALETSGLPADRLGLEITESVLMEDVETSVAVTRALRSIGVLVVLDDFGTGYSSLGYVKRFPVDVLKLDRSFVAGLGPGSTDSAIVAAVMSMARELRVRVVAEGVETEEQLDHLAGLGCGYVQGFYFSPAVAPATVEAMLAGSLPWSPTDAPLVDSRAA